MKNIITIIAILVSISFSYGQDRPNHSFIHKVVVLEVLQTTNYTYLLVKERADTIWLALPKIEAKVGESYVYQGGNEMKNFKSTELKRTFESVWFIGGVMNAESFTEKKPAPGTTTTTKGNTGKIKIDPVEGGITIKELFSHKKKYANKNVMIKGKVMKFTESIMGKNWIHLQDGTAYDGEFDLTITSDIKVETNQIIVIEGKIALDKDFGYGYFYKVIMEEGKIIP